MFTVVSTPTLTLPRQGGGNYGVIGQALTILVALGRLGGFCFSLPYFMVIYVGKNISVGITGMFWILLL